MLNHVQELKALNLPKGKYAIFGSGPIAVRGMRDANDIDIIVKADLWDELKQKYGEYLKQQPLSIGIGNIEIFRDWLDLSDRIDEMIDSAETIEDLPFVRLEYVLEWKESMGREKDKKDVEAIRDYLNKNKTTK